MRHPFNKHDRPSAAAPDILASLPQVELVITKGRARRRVRAIGEPAFLFGSAADCDLVLGDESFPGVFGYLLLRQEGVVVRRLGQGHLLCVNGAIVQQADLADGDRISMGPFEFVLRVRSVAGKAAPLADKDIASPPSLPPPLPQPPRWRHLSGRLLAG